MQYALPENGVVFFSFAAGLLQLHVHVNGTLTVMGSNVPIAAGALSLPVPPAVAAGWPRDLSQISLCGLRMAGRQYNFECSYADSAILQNQLDCKWTTSTGDDSLC